MMVHQWWLQLLAIAWVLVPAAASAQAPETRTAGAQSRDLADVVERLISRTHAFRHQEGRPPMSQQIPFQITNTSHVAIQYTIDGQKFSLPPQATYTHQQCRPPEVTFQWPGRQEPTMVHPNQEDRYTIVRGDAGAFRVEQG